MLFTERTSERSDKPRKTEDDRRPRVLAATGQSSERASGEPNFGALFAPHFEAMIACARRYTRQDRAEADDVVQDSLERAIKGWHNFTIDTGAQADACLRGWLLRVVQSAFVTRYHRERRAQRFADEPVDYMLSLHGMIDECDGLPEPDRESLSDECSEALASIDPARAEIVRRVDMRGQAYRQVADELGIPLGTVMSRLARGRDDLRERLAEFAGREYGLRNDGIRYGRAPQPAGKKRATRSVA